MASQEHPDFLTAVTALHERGWTIIPLATRSKNPNRPDWQRERHTREKLPAVFHTVRNVGVLLGEPSGWLIDIDLDSPEARAIAERLLPVTPCRFGRASAPASHWLYRVTSPVATRKYQDPSGTHGDEERRMLVEVRSTGCQTLVPPSVHPGGESIAWQDEGDPAVIDADHLQQVVSRLAAAALLARHWPDGSRHEAALALGGGLLRAGWDPGDAARFAGAVAHAAGDDEVPDRIRAVLSSATNLDAGRPVTGWPTLRKLIDSCVVDTVLAWLGLNAPGPAAPAGRALPPYDPFPVEVFPPVIARFLEEGARAMGVPVEFIAMPLLGFAAGLIGNLRVLQVKHSWHEPAILWTAVVGDPGSGKSPALAYARKPVDHIQQVAWDRYQDDLRQWQSRQDESLKGRLRPAPASQQPKLKSFYTTDATLEAIASMISMTAGLSVIRDELVGWVRSHDAYRAAGDRQAWLELWTGSSLKIDRKTSPTIFVTNPAISVVGGIQPDRLPDLRDDAATNDGFVDRLLPVWPDADPPPWTEDDVDAAVIEEVTRLFMRLRIGPTGAEIPRTVVQMDETARQHWVAWYDENRMALQATRGLAAGWAAKYPRQVLRIALVLHALHHSGDLQLRLPVEIIDGAIAIVECLRSHLNRILPAIGQPAIGTRPSGIVSRLHGILQRQRGEWISRSELHQAFGGNLRGEDLAAALRQLEDEGIAEQRAVPTEGRPRVEWRLTRNERTKEGPPEAAPSFVSSFFREDAPGATPRPDDPAPSVDVGTCCICGVTLEAGRAYLCATCAADGMRANEDRFGGNGEEGE